MTRILVCGSRDYTDSAFLNRILKYLNDLYKITVIIEGEAPGADTLAKEWAQASFREITVEKYPADWDKYGKAAGPIRNAQMLKEGKPDKVVAFVNKKLSESRGTHDMIKKAKEAQLHWMVYGDARSRKRVRGNEPLDWGFTVDGIYYSKENIIKSEKSAET